MSGLILFCHIKCDYAVCRIDFSDKLYSMLNWSAATGCKGNERLLGVARRQKIGKERDALEIGRQMYVDAVFWSTSTFGETI